MKFLRITMPDGSKYDVPAFLIAEHRALYYSGKEKDNEETMRVYNDEKRYALSDNDELMDWAANNMNWSDVEQYATLVGKEKIDFQEGWLNGDKEIVEKP